MEPDPFDTDPDPAFHFGTDPDPAFQFDTDLLTVSTDNVPNSSFDTTLLDFPRHRLYRTHTKGILC